MTRAVRVTVIMAVRNEGESLRDSLAAVLAQDYPQELMEVLVADGMSTDSTPDIVRELQASAKNLELIENPGRIVSTGLNKALGVARGDVIVRVDGHTVIERDYVRRCVEELATGEADNVGGKMVGVGEGSFPEAVVLATSSRFGVGGSRFHYSEERESVDTVYLGAWKREVFDRIGFFDEELVRNQDDELNYRLLDHGGRILLSPAIKSRYAVRSNPRALLRQYFQYGFWKVRVMQKHPKQMRLHHFVPPFFVGALACLTLLSFGLRWPRAALRSILLLYALGCGLATWNLRGTAEGKSTRYVPFVFPMLHLGYGSGFLWGLIRFAKFWAGRTRP